MTWWFMVLIPTHRRGVLVGAALVTERRREAGIAKVSHCILNGLMMVFFDRVNGWCGLLKGLETRKFRCLYILSRESSQPLALACMCTKKLKFVKTSPSFNYAGTQLAYGTMASQCITTARDPGRSSFSSCTIEALVNSC